MDAVLTLERVEPAAAEVERDDEYYYLNLGQLSDVSGYSQTTIRNFIRKYADFPIVEGGTHGVPYKFDVRETRPWIDRHRAEAEEGKKAEAERTAQLKLDYFGDALKADPEIARLTPKGEVDLMNARLTALTLSRKHGEILVKEDLEEAFGRALIGIRDELGSLVDHVARELALDREARNMVQERVDRTLRRLAERLGYRSPPAIVEVQTIA